jgi:hypothetical protein
MVSSSNATDEAAVAAAAVDARFAEHAMLQ